MGEAGLRRGFGLISKMFFRPGVVATVRCSNSVRAARHPPVEMWLALCIQGCCTAQFCTLDTVAM